VANSFGSRNFCRRLHEVSLVIDSKHKGQDIHACSGHNSKIKRKIKHLSPSILLYLRRGLLLGEPLFCFIEEGDERGHPLQRNVGAPLLSSLPFLGLDKLGMDTHTLEGENERAG